MARKMCCPTCKSTQDLQVVVTHDTNVTTTGGGYSGGKGCLGYLLFGPLGLLCGSCGGSKQKVQTTQTEKTMWICKSCGTKFMDLKEISKQIANVKKEAEDKKRSMIILGISFSILIPIVYSIVFDDAFFMTLFMWVILWGMCIVGYIAANKKEKKDLEGLYKEKIWIERSGYKEE